MDSNTSLFGGELSLVPCHGIWMPAETQHGNSRWISDYPDEGPFYADHTRAAVVHAAQNPSSTLVFSGGMTIAAAGLRSEARSYLDLAVAMDWWNSDAAPRC